MKTTNEFSDKTDLTKEQVSELEKKHGKLVKMEVGDKDGMDEPMYFWFKRPDLNTIRLAQKKLINDRDVMAYSTIIVRNSVLNGLDVIDNDEGALIALLAVADEITTNKVARIVKN